MSDPIIDNEAGSAANAAASASFSAAQPETEYVDIATLGDLEISLAPLNAGGESSVGVSSNTKREHKDKNIYVNPRTGLPVRPPPSFALFKHALKRTINGKVTFNEFNKLANERWSRMSEEEKKPYVDRAKTLLEHFKRVEVACLRKKVRQLQHQVKGHNGGARSKRNTGASTSSGGSGTSKGASHSHRNQ